MSEQATTKQIDYIIQLQQDWAYLIDADEPDWATDRDTRATITALATEQIKTEKDFQVTYQMGSDLTREERKARKDAFNARLAEIKAEIGPDIIAKREAAWAARQAALVAPVEGLTKAEASALIDALN